MVTQLVNDGADTQLWSAIYRVLGLNSTLCPFHFNFFLQVLFPFPFFN